MLGRGRRSSVGAWFVAALDIEEVLCGAVDAHVHVSVADVTGSLTLLIGRFWIGFFVAWAVLFLSAMRMRVCGLSLLPDLASRGLGGEAFRRDAP